LAASSQPREARTAFQIDSSIGSVNRTGVTIRIRGRSAG
jgi:hypothetical protein